jgi:hypothetical protein
MLKITSNDEKIVTKISFDNPNTAYKNYEESATHQQMAAGLAENRLASVIIDIERLDADLIDDPNYMHQTTHMLVSQIEEDARSHMTNHYMPMVEAEQLLVECELTLRANNWNQETIKSELLDGVFEAQGLALYPELIEIHKRQFQFDYSEETGEETEKIGWEKLWPRELIKLLMPRTRVQYDRVYSMPPPFGYWDYRNRFQQWFLVETPAGVAYQRGGSGSSGARLSQGLCGHAYALLATQGKDIPTWWLRYDSKNQLKLHYQWPTFYVVDRELSGNYQVDLRETASLFVGRRVHLEDSYWMQGKEGLGKNNEDYSEKIY